MEPSDLQRTLALEALCANVTRLLFTKLPGRSLHKRALIRSLFEGLPFTLAQKLAPQLTERSFFRAFEEPVEVFMQRPLFTECREEAGRERVSADETSVTVSTMKNFFEYKSGQKAQTCYTVDTNQQLYDKYVESFEEIRRRAAEGGRILGNPRSQKTFFYRLMKECNLVRVTQPKFCPYCDSGPAEKRVKFLKDAAAATDDPDEAAEFLKERQALESRLARVVDHRRRKDHQRAYIQRLRDSLQSNEALCFMDFVGWYHGQTKCEDLVVTLHWREDGVTQTKYIDIPCDDKASNAHNHFFLYQAYKAFLESPDMRTAQAPRFAKLYRVSDNGEPFLSRYSCIIEAHMQRTYNIEIEAIMMCPHHAWSLCDSHGGAVKPLMHRAEIQNQYPVSDDELQRLIEGTVRNTSCIPQAKIDIQRITTEFYQKLGGLDKVGPVKNISTAGQIRYVTDGGVIGFVLTRQLAGVPDVSFTHPVPAGHTRPEWVFHDQQGWVDDQRCRRCSALLLKQVFGAGHVCLFHRTFTVPTVPEAAASAPVSVQPVQALVAAVPPPVPPPVNRSTTPPTRTKRNRAVSQSPPTSPSSPGSPSGRRRTSRRDSSPDPDFLPSPFAARPVPPRDMPPRRRSSLSTLSPSPTRSRTPSPSSPGTPGTPPVIRHDQDRLFVEVRVPPKPPGGAERSRVG